MAVIPRSRKSASYREQLVRNDCAGFVLELQPKPTQTSQKPNAETSVVTGSCVFALVAVASNFALINQRSEIRISRITVVEMKTSRFHVQGRETLRSSVTAKFFVLPGKVG